MPTYGEYQTGTGDNNRGPAGKRATTTITNMSALALALALALVDRDYPDRTLTGKEELGDHGSGGGMDDIVRPQER